jgi:hypothetical protein
MTDAYFFNADSPSEVAKRVQEFAHRCEMIVRHVFHKEGNDLEAFKSWLNDLIARSDNIFLVLHDDPFYLVAEYLGVDMAIIENTHFAADYKRFARAMNW